LLDKICRYCQKDEDQVSLVLCRVCKKYACEVHQTQRNGVPFCSMDCGIYFFHAESDDADD